MKRTRDNRSGKPPSGKGAAALAARRFSRSNGARSRGWIFLIILVLATLGRVCGDEFVEWDDPQTIARNAAFNPPTVGAIAAYWVYPAEALYVPLTYTVWGALAYVARLNAPDSFGSLLNPWVYHGANLLIHLGATLVVYLLLRRLVCGVWPALIGAAVFGVHPVQVETVAWASGTKDLLCGLFIAASLHAWIWHRENPANTKRVLWFWFATLLACLSKPTGIVVPFAAMAMELTLFERRNRQAAKAPQPLPLGGFVNGATSNVLLSLVPAFVIAMVLAVIAHQVQPPVMARLAPLWARPLIALDSLAFYMSKLFWPTHLAMDYGRTPQVVMQTGALRYTWLAPLVAGVLVWMSRKRLPLLAAGALVALLGVAPVLGMVPFTFQAYSTVADHYLYPAMIGVAMVVAAVVQRRDSFAVRVAGGAVVLVLAVVSFNAAAAWQNSESLFTHTLSVNPKSFAAHSNRGVDRARHGDVAAAEADFRESIRLNPDYAFAHLDLAGVLKKRGDVDGAIAELREVLRIYKSQRNYNPQLGAGVEQMIAALQRSRPASNPAAR